MDVVVMDIVKRHTVPNIGGHVLILVVILIITLDAVFRMGVSLVDNLLEPILKKEPFGSFYLLPR